MKKILPVILAITMILTSVLPAAAMSVEEWDAYWQTDESRAGVICFPGSDESQRNISWFTKAEGKPEVKLTEAATGREETFGGTCTKTYDGDYANKVTVTGLKENTEYSYVCKCGDYVSGTYSFVTEDSTFSALYVTDVHISYDEENPDGIKNCSYKFNEVIEAAENNGNISLILSAGDQGSMGREDEYKGFSSPVTEKGLTVATAPGNHDRKGLAYRYFKYMPNEKKGINSSYIAGDYWFVKGDTLFMVMDSNSGSGMAHHSFMRSAVNANPDVKWRVVMMHHDLYSGRLPSREDETKLMRVLWAPMYAEFDIDLVLLGHSHYYTVSDVMYNNEIRQETSRNCTVENAEGTVCMVSGSINRPRNDDPENLGLNDTVGYYYEQQEDQVLYNIIDFSRDSITVKSYSYDTDECFNTLTLKKDTQQGGHPQKLAPVYSPAVYFIGTIYQFFNNISAYSKIKEYGYEISLFEFLFG